MSRRSMIIDGEVLMEHEFRHDELTTGQSPVVRHPLPHEDVGAARCSLPATLSAR
jgi:hypothetical protein